MAQSAPLGTLAIFFAEYVPYALGVLFLSGFLFSRYRASKKLYSFCILAVATGIGPYIITQLIRYFYHRPRPFTVLPIHQLLVENSWSFPSMHATIFFAMATVVYMHDAKWGIVFFVATILMSLARVASGVHYPTDILGGMVIGIAFAYASVRWGFAEKRF